MTGVAGWDECAFSAAFDERPVLGRLQIVMVAAEPYEPLEDRRMCLRPIPAVVVLQEREAVAALRGAGRVQPLERGLLVGVGTTPQMSDADNVLAFGDDGGEERVFGVEEVADRRGG